MASNIDSDGSNDDSGNSVDDLSIALDGDAAPQHRTEWTSPMCPVSSVGLLPQEITRGTQFSGRQTLPVIPSDPGINHRSSCTNDGGFSNDTDRTIRGSRIAEEYRCNNTNG